MTSRTAAGVVLASGIATIAVTGAAGQTGRQPPPPGVAARPTAAIHYLKAAYPSEDDKLGVGDPLTGVTMAMSADGNTLAVSAMHDDSGAVGVNGNERDESAWDSGAVYVFVRTGERWAQQAYLKPSNTQSADRFGFSLALSGDGQTLAVGAAHEDSAARGINGNGADDAADSSGAAYVFVRTGTRWAQQAYVKASNTGESDQFGWSVALSHDGNTLAVGAQSESSGATRIDGDQADNGADSAGAVYVFARRGTAWTQQAYVKPSNAQAGDRFGFCVSLSGDGDTLAACSYDEDGGATGVNGPKNEDAPGAGAVYLFARRAATWTETTYLKPSNTIRNQAFGASVALSADGGTLAVGAADETSLSRGVNSDQRQTVDNQISAGAVYVFARAADTWAQQAYVKPFNTGRVDLFGVRTAISRDGRVLIVGAPGQAGAGRGVNPPNPLDLSVPESGAAYVLVRQGGAWSQQRYLKAPNAEAYDQFGSAVAVSGDGARLAVSAPGDDSASAGIGGNQGDNTLRDAGAVFVF